ncbi:MAG: radical SAM protein [Candidatus Omnitrophica bacterium]|nr:radical SAM protein [Candidatus Omnitrophota bacterium]
MKIAFIVPPSLDTKPPAERIFGCNYGIYPQPNIFILYPATIVKNAGYNVSFLDFALGKTKAGDFREFFKSHKYDICVFYTVFLSKKNDLKARSILTEGNSDGKFIFLSTEPTANPQDFVSENSIVIRGEPESRILAVIEALEKNDFSHIPGISYMEDGRIRHNASAHVIEDLDILPFPDRTLLDRERYYNPKLSAVPFTTMIASRGCSFKCYYCIPNSLDFSREIEFKREHKESKPPVRLRSAQNVIKEFRMLARAGYKAVSFLDDQFVWGDKRTVEICEGIRDCNIQWSCLARADMLQNEAVVSSMAQAGCRNISLGIESFNQDILDYIGKGCKVELFYSAVRNLKKHGIEAVLNILLGASPLETVDTIEHTFRQVLLLDPDYVLFSVCTPFPYTKFNEIARKEGWMVKPEYEAIDPVMQAFISYPHLKKNDLEKIIKRLYLRYYFRPAYLVKKIQGIRTMGDLRNKLLAGRKILGFKSS